MGDVRHFGSSPLSPAREDPELASMLRRLADAAESGQIRGISICVVDRAEMTERFQRAQRSCDAERLAGLMSESLWHMWAQRAESESGSGADW